MKCNLAYLTLVLLILIVSLPSIDGQSTPNAEIIKIDYPTEVLAGAPFTVVVTIEYSNEGWALADLGLFWKTNVLDYVRYYLTGQKTRSFNLTAIAPGTSGNLELRVSTRYWHRNYWLSNENGSIDFSLSVLGSAESDNIYREPLVESIGQNKWYYWNNVAGKTCLIWLSGGHAYTDHVTMNPYDMETYGAMKYINELSKNFSVLALNKGTESHRAPNGSTYYALGYYPNSVFLEELHDWSENQGYNFTYMIGYSTGGTAAGYEVTVRDPETWAAPNGAVIISAPLEGLPPNNLFESTSYANKILANTLLIYGEIWSEELWPQGKRFYDMAPQKTAVPWYRKDWLLLPDSSHEIWVKEEDGAHYNNNAKNLTVDFIEKCKSPWNGLSEWNDGGLEIWDMTANTSTEEQKPKTSGTPFDTKVGNILKIKIWLYNCSSLDTCTRTNISYVKVDLYSSLGYLDTRYTNNDGYGEFIFEVPDTWKNENVKIFITLGWEFRGIYSPTINLTVNS